MKQLGPLLGSVTKHPTMYNPIITKIHTIVTASQSHKKLHRQMSHLKIHGHIQHCNCDKYQSTKM